MQTRHDPEGALRRPAGGSPAPLHTVRLIDLPQYDTARDPIEQRLTAFLTGLRKRRLLLAYFGDLREREQESAPAPAPPYRRGDLWELREDVGLSSFGDLSRAAQFRLKRRVDAVVERRHRASGLGHLRDKGERERLRPLLGNVPAVTVSSEDRADEIAAALHEEMPWMAPATKAAWDALRRSAREGTPVRIGPLILVGPPGVGKTAWANRLAGCVGTASSVIDASRGLASFSLAGTERGWGTAQPGRPLQAMLDARLANPVIVVDEVCKASSLRSMAGVSASFLPALLGLLEPESARAWDCPYFRVRIDMSHLSWVMTANTLETLPEPVLSRCQVLHIPDVTPAQLQEFARRRGAALGLPEVAIGAVAEVIARAPEVLRLRLSLRDVNRMLERAEDLANRPTLH